MPRHDTRYLPSIAGALAFACFAFAGPAVAQLGSQWRPPLLEALQLPEYCHGQFIPEFASVPSKNMPACGGRMNHLCPGLVLLNRASNPSLPKSVRRDMLTAARGDFEYSLSAITPTCPILGEVKAAHQRAQLMLTILQ